MNFRLPKAQSIFETVGSIMASSGWRFPDYPPDWDAIRDAVKRRDGYRCVDCGTTNTMLHAHHIVSLYKGGTNDLWNLKTVCESCHASYHDHMQNPEPKQPAKKTRKSKPTKTTMYCPPATFGDMGLPGQETSQTRKPPNPSDSSSARSILRNLGCSIVFSILLPPAVFLCWYL